MWCDRMDDVVNLVPVWLSVKGDVHLVDKDRVVLTSHLTQLSYNHSTVGWATLSINPTS